MIRLKQLADEIHARLIGDGNTEIAGIASLAAATSRDLVFVDDEKRLADALASLAAGVIAGEFAAGAARSKPLLIATQPKLAFARAAALLYPPAALQTGVHPSAVVRASASLGKEVGIGPNVVIGENVVVGDRTQVGAGTFIGARAKLGGDCFIAANVTIYPGVALGDRVIVHAGAVLGSDGFGYVRDPASGRYEKFPQIGRLEIGNDVEIGANVTIDRGALDATVIGRGVKLDNLVHVAHNVTIGENVVIAAQTGISGTVEIGKDVVVAGQVGIADHVRIEEGVILGAQCGVPSNKVIRGKGILFWGTPARPIREYLKELAVLARFAKKE